MHPYWGPKYKNCEKKGKFLFQIFKDLRLDIGKWIKSQARKQKKKGVTIHLHPGMRCCRDLKEDTDQEMIDIN